jgi:hypothetical protein
MEFSSQLDAILAGCCSLYQENEDLREIIKQKYGDFMKHNVIGIIIDGKIVKTGNRYVSVYGNFLHYVMDGNLKKTIFKLNELELDYKKILGDDLVLVHYTTKNNLKCILRTNFVYNQQSRKCKEISHEIGEGSHGRHIQHPQILNPSGQEAHGVFLRLEKLSSKREGYYIIFDLNLLNHTIWHMNLFENNGFYIYVNKTTKKFISSFLYENVSEFREPDIEIFTYDRNNIDKIRKIDIGYIITFGEVIIQEDIPLKFRYNEA